MLKIEKTSDSCHFFSKCTISATLDCVQLCFLWRGGGGAIGGLPKVQMKDGGGGYRDLAVAIKGFS